MRNFSCFLCALLALSTLVSSNAYSEDRPRERKASIRLEVIDSYAEMHKGPGKGYPVFYVVEQGEFIEILTRRPEWYEVRTDKGNVGWVTASQIARTLQDSGEPADLSSVGFGDYVKNRWRLGMTTGIFSSGELDDADTISINFGYQLLSWLGPELEFGKLYGDEVRGDQWSVNIAVEPFSKWRLSPALFIGTGRTSIDVQPRLVPLSFEKEDHEQYGLRLHYYVGRNFVIRGEHRWLSISTDAGDEDSRIWNLGFSTFF